MNNKRTEHTWASLSLGDEDEANMDIELPSEEYIQPLNFHEVGDDPYYDEDGDEIVFDGLEELEEEE